MTNKPQIERPDLIVPDTGPLIHLAQADALHLLHQIGGRVVVADMVALEATQDMAKPGARQIEAWIEAGRQPGSNAPVLVAETEIGALFLQARKTDPDIRLRNAGELAILEWLGSYVEHTGHAGHDVLIVYENGKIPRFVRETGLDLDTDVLTTRAFLELAERRGIVASAADYWQRIVAAAPTANPDINIMMQRRPGTGGS
ncbi:hypothetical protein [Sphingomonas solaris]|uniref:Uncharacterized protein n=1 Tax=Alterirhizorhabdus solaris TaxID=2529389 RepID=A0A558R3Z3_9SPHN|nr:hypothetical protein [Sphingomonas solaris]TVV74100.1 hypothetical protein FOY91_10750 [Sphingomonas solaris]